jgi:hypothetical protein
MSPLRSSLFAAPALAALLLGTLIAGGCGASPAGSDSTSSSGVPSSAHIIARTATAASTDEVDGHQYLKVSASCHDGEQMLAGGYSLEDVFESDYFLLAAYPSAPGTWTVRTDSGSTYQLQAIVYCLSGYPPLGLRILRDNSCPAGTVQTNSGFDSTSPDNSPGTGISYVICGSRHLTATGSGFLVGGTEVDCTSQSTGTSLSETRSFSYTCSVADSRTPTATIVITGT